MRYGLISLTAKNQTDGGIFAFANPMFARVVEIHVHLARIPMGESTALQIDHHQAPQLAMKEEEVDAIPFVADPEPALASHKSEIAAQF